MKKKSWFVIILLTIVGNVLSGCNLQQVNKDKTYDVYTQKTTKALQNKVYKMGETVELDGVQITIDKAYFTKPSMKENAKNNNVLTVDLQVWSKPLTKGVYINPSDFSLYDPQENLKLHYNGYSKQEINSTISEVNTPNKNVVGVEGNLYFDTSKFGKYELVYKPPFSKKINEIRFKITPKQ
ncbi:DUF4352 domain-containing protein [Bacillus sp. AFS017336]|uniref:DUF4352 domain-containing protein n=1 Tax=Bacillus sp. AFS017336 TaxID=2033489 RepID=UPI000BEFF880|nr:DUF4352 domain-containing protein [Bacillus sp. AFS017336]PEL13685.1 hypothetical protein CN601_02935 [Bacillus sp. AFS017336]